MSEQREEQAYVVRAWYEGRRRFGSGVALEVVGDFYGVFVDDELRSLRTEAAKAIEDARGWVAEAKREGRA